MEALKEQKLRAQAWLVLCERSGVIAEKHGERVLRDADYAYEVAKAAYKFAKYKAGCKRCGKTDCGIVHGFCEVCTMDQFTEADECFDEMEMQQAKESLDEENDAILHPQLNKWILTGC